MKRTGSDKREKVQIHTAEEHKEERVASLVSITTDTIIDKEINFTEEGLLPDILIELIHAKRSERCGRRFKIITIPPEEITLTINELLNKRGLVPLLGNVYRPLDLSPLHLPSRLPREEGEKKKHDKEEKDTVIPLDENKELLIYHSEDCPWGVSIKPDRNGPLLYGKGALYSQLGIEPTPPFCISSKTAKEAGANSSTVVFIHVDNLDQPFLPPSSSSPPFLCVEVERGARNDPEIEKEYNNKRLGYSYKLNEENKKFIKRWQSGPGVLHNGYHGSDMRFSMQTEDEFLEDPASYIIVVIGDCKGIHVGPMYHLIPAGFSNSGSRRYKYKARYAPAIRTQGELMEHARNLLRKAGLTELEDNEQA